MEINVGELRDVKFIPEIAALDPRERGAMSMAVVKSGEIIRDYYEALYRHLYQPQNEQPVMESVIAFASSQNGVDFTRSGVFSVEPTRTPNSLDQLAVEDPTIVKVDGIYYVFHTAVRPKTNGEGVETAIQLVRGRSLQDLGGKTTILTPLDVREKLGKVDMVKEPEFIQMKDGSWTMIYEYADSSTSRVAIASAAHLEGPYNDHRLLFDTRENSWDSEHVSAGPIIITPGGDICIFYNGRGPRNEVDKTPTWAIGYGIIDASTGETRVRSNKPIIVPSSELGPGNQLIAFANSITKDSNGETQTLYYTEADRRSACAKLTVRF